MIERKRQRKTLEMRDSERHKVSERYRRSNEDRYRLAGSSAYVA